MKYRLLSLLLLSGSVATAQLQWGLKGGLNFSDQLKLSNLNISNTPDSFDYVTDQQTGWHAGLFSQVNFAVFRLRSELNYSTTTTSIDNESFTINTVDLPLTFGYKFLPPFSVFVGPVFQYQITDDSFESFAVDNLENELKTGLHLGVRAYFKKVGIDLRYERPFSPSEQELINPSNQMTFGRFNSRENQWILGISVQLN